MASLLSARVLAPGVSVLSLRHGDTDGLMAGAGWRAVRLTSRPMPRPQAGGSSRSRELSCRGPAWREQIYRHSAFRRGPPPLDGQRRFVASIYTGTVRACDVTRSLPAPLLGRDGLVHRLVDAEDLRQPGDPEDLQYPLPRADQI